MQVEVTQDRIVAQLAEDLPPELLQIIKNKYSGAVRCLKL